LIDWLFHAVDVERKPYGAIAKELKAKGIPVEPSSVWRLVVATRAEYQDNQTVESRVVERMKGESVTSMTEDLLCRRMLYFVAKGDLEPSETAELARVMLAREQLQVRRLEALASAYKAQRDNAEFVKDVLLDIKKAEALRAALDNPALTGEKLVHEVRLIVYGGAAVEKPPGFPDIRDVA
jgi:hypothetical protein